MSNRTKTFWTYLIPAIFTNVCVFLFGIIDGIFVGNGVGTNALGAVNIVWPFVMITYGINLLTSIGGVAITAIRFGRGDIEGANRAFMHSLLFTIGTSAIISLLGTILTEPISKLLGAGNTYINLVRDYLFWYALFTVPASLSVNLQHYCRNDGSPGLVAIVTVISTSLNIFLDWLFVFPLHMGIMGAALATGISQTVSFLLILSHYLLHKGKLRIQKVKIDVSLFRKISLRGAPEMIAQFASPVTIYCMNLELAKSIGDLGINTYAIICYVASFSLAIMYGVSEGLQPLFGQSYGANNKRNLNFYFYNGLIVALVGSLICVIITNFFSRDLCFLLGADLTTTDSTVIEMPKYSWGFVLAGINALISAYLYSTKRSGASIILNTFRSFIFNSFCILLLPLIFGINIVWYSYGISEILVLILGFFLIRPVLAEIF